MFDLELADGRHLTLDVLAGRLTFADGAPVPLPPVPVESGPFPDAPAPRKSRAPKLVVIQLGLACNQSCPHCFQAGQTPDAGAHPERVGPLLASLHRTLRLGRGEDVIFDFRGGEPFAYSKTLLPLGDALHQAYPLARMMTITNGTLLTPAIMAWARGHRLTLSVSHDGPATLATRGFDPLADLNTRSLLREAIRNGRPRITFNVVLSAGCRDITEARAFIAGRLKLPSDAIRVITQGFPNAYSAASAQIARAARADWRQNVALGTAALLANAENGATRKLGSLFRILAAQRPALSHAWGCGKASPDTLVIDLQGNILSCHNVTAADGHGHGTLADIDQVSLPIPHWSQKPECLRCPVLRSCHGGCFIVPDTYRDDYCDDRFYSRLPILAAAVERLTGSALVAIHGENIRNREENLIRLTG